MLTVIVRSSKQQHEELDLAKINLFSSQSEEDQFAFTHGRQFCRSYSTSRAIKETDIHVLSVYLQAIFAGVAYESVQDADDQTGGLIQKYIDSVNQLIKNSATQGSKLETNYKLLCEDIKRRMDIESKKPNEDKDPTIGFKINIEIAKCLLESSKSESNLQIQENLISWGLHGLILIHNRSPKAIEHTWIKLCINTYNILDILDTPVIYNIYWHCWNFLSFASACGFKLELLEWQILKRSSHCLKASAGKNSRFHFHVLNCLLNFLETEPYLPVSPSTSSENDQTSLQLDEEQFCRLKQMTYYGITKYSKKCVQEAMEQRKSTNMEDFLEDIKKIVDKQLTVITRNETFSALNDHQKFAIVNTALKLHDYHEMIRNYRWLILQRIANLEDNECTHSLIKYTFPWLLKFLKKLPYDNISKEVHSYAILFANTLIIAESTMQKRQRITGQRKNNKGLSARQPMTINDINEKKEVIENEEKYGEVRMELLSQKCFKPAFQTLLHDFKFNNQDEYLKSVKIRRYAQYIKNSLFAPHNSQIQALSLDQIPIYEKNMLRIMTFKMIDCCIKNFWKHSEMEGMEKHALSSQMSIIYNTRSLLGLLNRIYWMTSMKDKSENIQGHAIIFGTSTNTSEQNTIHSLPSSNDMRSSEVFVDEIIQRIGLNNFHSLISLTSIPHILLDNIAKIDLDKSLNIRENGINRVKFLVNHVISQVNANESTNQIEVTTKELLNRFKVGKNRAIELKKRAEISENIEKQIEE
ncbi:hypothetical protein F8M41_023893 [Gigaspora margarita]|uniref:Uncharacterized protein n=1 Tax=Gigaspora margarita TaxID=4874 RepID=A0A8H4ACK4_GIGMA|nr:hypothetical protein F8M41_023893 [Gigaspora margarita]